MLPFAAQTNQTPPITPIILWLFVGVLGKVWLFRQLFVP